MPTVRSLLATYDFIDFGAGFVNVNSDPALRNNLVLDLNNGLDLVPTADPNPFAELDERPPSSAAGREHTANLVVERTGTAAEDVLLPFTDFLANDAGAAMSGMKTCGWRTAGIRPCRSNLARSSSSGMRRVNIRLFYWSPNRSHRTDVECGCAKHHPGYAQGRVPRPGISPLARAGEYQRDFGDQRPGWKPSWWMAQVAAWATARPPACLTEIPGSIWFGEADGFGFVTGTVVEPLHLELTGLGEDYYVMVSVERFGRPAGGVVSSGFLAQGERADHSGSDRQFRFIFLPLVIR